MVDDAAVPAAPAPTSITSPVIIRTRSPSSSAEKCRGSVAAGSVWESRMKNDGFKVFDADARSTSPSVASSSTKSPKKTAVAPSDPSFGSVPSSPSSGKRKQLQFSCSTSPAQDTQGKRDRRTRKPPVPIMRSRSAVIPGGSTNDCVNSPQLRKSKSEGVRIEQCGDKDSGSAELRNTDLEIKEKEGSLGELDDKSAVDEKAFINESELSGEEEGGAEELGGEEEESESEEEKKISEIKEIVVFEPKRAETPDRMLEQVDEEIDRVPAMPRIGPKSMLNQAPRSHANKEQKQMRIRRNVTNPLPPSKHISADFHSRRSEFYQNYAKSSPGESPGPVGRHSKLQNLTDLIMWRDVSRSTLVFGLGTFTILSSSYTQEVNISCISVASYMGLVYLAIIFLYRSLVCRGRVMEEEEEGKYVLGEEEAMWVIRLVLPYLNEFLLKLKALFSGDPSTTMKLAVLLFVSARCASSITIWNLAKFGFFVVFVVPKLCSSYSSHIAAYGTFWVRRFRDAWDSCTHKKAVAGAVFTLIWNLSSAVARIWAVFMVYVAFRYYQQKMMREDAEYATTVTEDEDVAIRDRSKATGMSEGKKASMQ
ncbi:hypothetical protein MLD38_006315 [Melastoma candidum]|uniref:Uncharacterized protein n=1 Tax=Melastoma candidum TaxID=119954 RepID=A0ACB9RR82_9MYRT|nr:hypothetical protein MLD38_006315 [Melastoma candidum]